MDSKIDLLMSTLNNLEVQFTSLKNSTTNSADATDPITVFESLFLSFKALVMCELSSIKEHMKHQDEKLNNMEQYSRRNCLLIHGVTEDGFQTENACVNEVVAIFHQKMKVDVQASHIDRAHRIGPQKRDGKSRPIIVKFVSYYHRRLAFSNKKLLKGSGVHITESLTKANFQLLLEAKAIYSASNVWTLDGRVMINDGDKKYVVSSMDQLRDMSVKTLTHPSPPSSPYVATPTNLPAPSSPSIIPTSSFPNTSKAYNTRAASTNKTNIPKPKPAFLKKRKSKNFKK